MHPLEHTHMLNPFLIPPPHRHIRFVAYGSIHPSNLHLRMQPYQPIPPIPFPLRSVYPMIMRELREHLIDDRLVL